MKNHRYASSSPQTKDDNNKVEKKKNAFMQHLLHHDAETSENITTKTRTRERGWIDDTTRKEHQHQHQLSQSAPSNAEKKHPFPPGTSAQVPKPRHNAAFRSGEEVFREKKPRNPEGLRRERAERRREQQRDQSSSVTTTASQSSSWKTTPTKVKTETIRTTTFTTTSEEGDTTNVDLGAEWQDILNQHAPLREYVRKRALEEKKESIFSTRGENDEKEGKTNNEAFIFAKEELRLLRKRFIEGDADDITESIVVALQFDIDAGGLLDQFEREKLKRIRAMENGTRKASGLTARIGIARVEYLSFPRDDFDENYLFDIASRRIKDSFYAHGGGTAVLKDLEHSGKNGARIETPRPPFGNFPIINENDDIDDADDSDSDRSSNSARSDADEEENTNEEKKQRVNIQGAFAALGLQSIISFVSPKAASKEIRKEATTQTAEPQRNTKNESSSFKKRSRSVYVTNTGSEDITLVALRIVDAKNINDDEPENITTINSNSSGDKNKDPKSSSFSSSVFSLRDDYNVSSSKYHHRTTRREKNNNTSRKRPIVRIPAGGVYQATVDCTIDSETKRAHVTSWIIAIFGTKKNELRACATQCSVLITSSNVFNEPTHVSLLSEEATPFIPESMRRAFDRKAQEYYPPPRSYLDVIWGGVGRYFLSIENRNILPAPADYYDSKLPTWLFTYQFNRTMILDPSFKFFFESKNHAPWTKSLEWASVFRDFSSYSSSSSSEKESFEKIRLKSARLLYIEEAQQNKDVKRYDMFNRTIRRVGAISEQNELLVYSLEVPGLQNGYPPIVVGDVVRCRVNAKAHQKELSPFLEYAFRIIAIVSKTQTVHLQAPWTDGTLNTSPQLSAKNGMPRTLKVHVRFAMDENFFSRCRAALRACAYLKVKYPQIGQQQQQRQQQQQQQEVLQQQNYQHQHHAVKKISILPSEGGNNNAGRVKFELFISAPIARKFDRLVAKFDAAFARESAEEYERREQLEEINNGTVMKNIITWDGIPHGRLDLVVSSLKRQFDINDAVNILYPHPFVRRSLRSADRMIHDKMVDNQFNSIPFKDKLFPFQSEGVKFVLKRDGRAMIGDEMGLGKSIQALGVSKVYSKDWPCVIFCPSSLKDTWKHEIEKWLGGVDGDDGKGECAVKVRKIESAKESKDILNEMRKNSNGSSSASTKIDFIIVPYSICNQIQKELFELVFNVMKANVVVCDESHFLKDRKAKRTMAVVPFLIRAKRAICLTGTPALAKPIELFSQLTSLRPDIFPKLSEYGQRYCSGGRFGAFSGSSESQELFAVVSSSVMIRRKKKDVLTQLPPKQREQIFLEIPKAERTSKIQPIVQAMNALPETETLERKMLMNKYYLSTAEAKVKTVQNYLQNLLESVDEEKKILFFAHHKCLLHAAVETMEKTKTKFIRIDGETPSGLRQGLVDSFQRCDANSPKVAVLSIKAAGVGLTLTRASLVVFSEYSWTPAEILQAEDRAHRIGQRDSVLVQFLHAKDSVDDIIWQSVQNKLETLGHFLDGTKKGNKMETKMEDAADRRQSFDATQKTLDEFVGR